LSSIRFAFLTALRQVDDIPSVAQPQPRDLGIGELTTKGAKNAKKKSDYLAQRRKGAKKKNGFRT
jgi:hypothetical protein